MDPLFQVAQLLTQHGQRYETELTAVMEESAKRQRTIDDLTEKLGHRDAEIKRLQAQLGMTEPPDG